MLHVASENSKGERKKKAPNVRSPAVSPSLSLSCKACIAEGGWTETDAALEAAQIPLALSSLYA